MYAALAVILPSKANTFTWSGGGGNGNWSNSANWGGVGTPGNGDTIVFPGGASRLINTNDIPGLILSDIRFTGNSGGYNISGSAFTLTNSISSTNTAGANTINNNITVTLSNTIVNVGSGILLSLDGNLNGVGGMMTTNTGTLEFSGLPPNSFTGTMWVSGGLLILNRNGVNNSLGGPLVITTATVQLAQIEELPFTPITVNQGGLLNLNNDNDFIGNSLTLNGNGSVQTGNGTLIIKSNAVVNANPGFFQNNSISGNLSIAGPCTFSVAFNFGGLVIPAAISGSGPINFTGTGLSTLSASNSFTGQLNILGGLLTANNNNSLGATNGSVTISNTAQLTLSGSISVVGKTVVDASTSTNGSFNGEGSLVIWAGPVNLAAPAASIYVPTNDVLVVNGVMSGSGGFSNWGPGVLFLEGPGNTYSGAASVAPGSILWLFSTGTAIPGNLNIGGIVTMLANNQVSLFSRVMMQDTAVLHMGSYYDEIDSLDGGGVLDIGTAFFSVGESGYFSQFHGTITNTGSLYSAAGTLKLTGYNPGYNGIMYAQGGGFLIDNSFASVPLVQVEGDFAGSGALGGNGSVGNITVYDGLLEPGDPVGEFNCDNVVLTNTAYYWAALDGSTPGLGYAQLVLHGGLTIYTNSYLSIIPTFPPDDGPTNGQQFFVITNLPNGAINGIFNGMPGGYIATAVDGSQYRVDYSLGGLNNLVLTYTNAPSQLATVAVSAGNGNAALDPNECNNVFVTLRNTGSNVLTGVSAVLRSLTPGVSVTQPFSPYPNMPGGTAASNAAPFQVYTMPWLPCSTPITLQATFTTANSGTFSVPVTFQSGAPLQFDNLTSIAIPDPGAVTSSIPVSGLTGPIAKVDVLLQINHSYDSDLAATLVAPDGTTVNLFNHDGQNGQNFGTACGSDTTETIFDDYAVTGIGDGVAPFQSSFRPLNPLSAFNGKTGTNVNNAKWFLHVSDNAVGNSGILNCWSLRIWPQTCAAGSGVCELCPNTTIYGVLGTNSPLINRLTRNGGLGSTCAAPASCPGEYGESIYYDAYTFRNGPEDACITVTVNAPTMDIFSAAYLGSLDPVNTCNNYLADASSSTFETPNGQATYSFQVASNAVFVVEANGVFGSYGAYSLSVTGGSCQPVLDINSAGTNHVALGWTTAAGGYLLEGSGKFGPTANWQSVTNPPLVQGGQFVVTNTVGGTNLFYRLRKPVQ